MLGALPARQLASLSQAPGSRLTWHVPSGCWQRDAGPRPCSKSRKCRNSSPPASLILPAAPERLGWVLIEIDEDAEEDGDQVAVAVGSDGRRVPVIMSALACIPGDPSDKQVTRLKADIGAAHPTGAVLVFNQPTGWLPEQGGGGLVHGGLLWSDNAWSDFVLRLGGGFNDAVAQRGRDLAHPDARTVKELGFAEASGVLHSLAAYLAGLEPGEANVQFLRSADG